MKIKRKIRFPRDVLIRMTVLDRTDESNPGTDRQKSTPIFRRRVVSDPERNGNSYDCFMDLAQK